MEVLFEFVYEVLGLVPRYGPAAAIVVSLVQLIKFAANNIKYKGSLVLGFLVGRAGLVSLVLNAIFWTGAFFAVQAGYENQLYAVLEDATNILEVVVPVFISSITSYLAYQAAKKTGVTGKVEG